MGRVEKCIYCEDLEKESDAQVHELYIEGGFYYYGIPINYCPCCGKKIEYKKKYKRRTK